MKKLLPLLLIFASCQKEPIDNCAKCYLVNGQLWSYVCEDELDNQTIEEYIEYWDNASDLNCQKSQ
jgi:hypothetical protein